MGLYNEQQNKPIRDPKCGDKVYQVAYGRGQIIEVGLTDSGAVKGFTVLFESGKEKDFVFPTSFLKGMYYLDEKDSFININPDKQQNKETITKQPVEKKTDSKTLFNKLKGLRLSLSHQLNLPAYCIFPDATLLSIAEKQPITKSQMLAISGVGETKYAQYGEMFINEIRKYKGLESLQEATPETKSYLKPDTYTKSDTNIKHTVISNSIPTSSPVKKREEYMLDGEKYYLIRGRWVDSHNTTVSKEELYKLNELRLRHLNLSSMSTNEIIDLAQSMKDSDDLIYSVKLFDELLKRRNDAGTVHSILPRYTSILRKLERPKEAIDMFEKYYSKFGKSIYSPALFTSLAASYCDLGNWIEARNKANMAKAMSGGDASLELISVYARIKSMEK